MADIKDVLEKLHKMDEKLDILDSRVDNVDVTLARQNLSLEHHIKRSDQLDAALAIVTEDVHPIKEHVSNVRAVAKFAAWLLGAAATIVGILSFFK